MRLMGLFLAMGVFSRLAMYGRVLVLGSVIQLTQRDEWAHQETIS